MKTKTFLIAILLNCSLLSFAQAKKQTPSKYIIEHCVDEISFKEYYLPKNSLILLSSDNVQGFKITPNIVKKGDSLSIKSFIVKQANIGSCQEKDILYIQFENKEVVTLDSWNKFNCEGTAYFDIDEYLAEKLKTTKILTIRFKNGYSGDYYTHTLKQNDSSYFIRFYTNSQVVEIKCNN
jgi:hypothetical protein